MHIAEKMLLVDLSFVMEEISRQHQLGNTGVLQQKILCFVSRLAQEGDHSNVVVAIEGRGHAGVIEKRRRAAYAAKASHSKNSWILSIDALPGTKFHDTMTSTEFDKQGWAVIQGGTSLEAIGKQLRTRESSATTLYTSERSANALYVLNDVCQVTDDIDDVIIGMMVHGGLVQDIPKMQVHPVRMARARQGHNLSHYVQGKLCLDRVSLVAVLAKYCHDHVERSNLSQANFPHGTEGVCDQYLDAVDRELGHLTGTAVESLSVYIHGCAPSAIDLMHHVHELEREFAHEDGHERVSEWTLQMQLVAILPNTNHELKWDLSKGCVHMFPTTYEVWRGYPLLPTIDYELLGRGIHRTLECLDV